MFLNLGLPLRRYIGAIGRGLFDLNEYTHDKSITEILDYTLVPIFMKNKEKRSQMDD